VIGLSYFSFGIRVFGLRRFHSYLHRAVSVESKVISQTQIQRTSELINLAARHGIFQATCLTRSLLLEWMLRRRGVAAEMRIGVRLNGGRLDAHAWVEHAGIPVNDRPDVAERFRPFAGSMSDRLFVSR
jgi:hypothetical protein